MPTKTIRLRYDGTCAVCGHGVVAGTRAVWDSHARTVTEPACAGEPPEQEEIPVSTAGASAWREYERLHRRREARIDGTWGKLAGAVKFLSDDPASTKAWAKGAEGEERLGAALEKDLGQHVVFLHDRSVPGTRGNIDHIAVSPSGVWIIDAKAYEGRVEQRDVGGGLKSDLRLYVNGRDRTKLIEGMDLQWDAVRTALGEQDVPVKLALCFVGAEWPVFAKPFTQGGVWVLWRKKLVEMLKAPGALDRPRVVQLANQLAEALPSKRS
jgi:Nuclease-related domain